ncbi:MAG: DUF192 domain-containing protein [Paracoccaceae bacterium]
MGIGRAAIVLLVFGGAAQAECSDTRLDLQTTSGGLSRFTVEVADDDAERATGLMNRDSMPTAAGMLFVYPRAGNVSFWMENTLIPLDMVFADSTGTVQRVHENAVPLDRTPIPGGSGIKFVLEINGGLARRMGITEGAVIRHPAIDQSVAAFPCVGQ